MFQLLTPYLLENKKLNIDGIGQFQWVPKTAVAAYSRIEPPSWEIQFIEQKKQESPLQNPDHFFSYLASRENISPENARQLFDEFARNTLVKLNDKEKIIWEELGTLEKVHQHIQFTPTENQFGLFEAIHAEKVTRPDASHQVLIGEKETSSAAIKAEQLKKRPYWTGNKVAFLLVTLTLLASAVYFLKNGCHLNTASNQQKTQIQKPAETYKIQ